MKKINLKNAYTLAEIVITMVVLAIVVSVTLQITTSKIERVNKYNYYAAYTLLSDLASELIYESEDGTVTASLVNDDTGNTQSLCAEMEERINIYDKELVVNGTNVTPSCTASHSITTSTDFTALTPNLVTRNGMRFYNLNRVPAAISQLAGEDENDAQGYTIYIDIDNERGSGKLYQDVYPFYLTLSGKVVPAYPSSGNSGGNSNFLMQFSVRYDEITTDSRRIEHWLLKSKSFQEAACQSGYIQSAFYCGTQTIAPACSYENSDCIMVPVTPIKYMIR